MTEETITVEEVDVTNENSVDLHIKANDIIRTHMYTAFGVGLIPIPIADLTALTAVQINLVRTLAKHYGVSFYKEKVKNILISLASAVAPTAVGPTLASLIKFIPIIGSTAGAVTMPVIAGGMTYATGNIFVAHFESGGTLLTFDADKMKKYYKDLFSKGKEVAQDIKTVDESDTTEDVVVEKAEAVAGTEDKAKKSSVKKAEETSTEKIKAEKK